MVVDVGAPLGPPVRSVGFEVPFFAFLAPGVAPVNLGSSDGSVGAKSPMGTEGGAVTNKAGKRIGFCITATTAAARSLRGSDSIVKTSEVLALGIIGLGLPSKTR